MMISEQADTMAVHDDHKTPRREIYVDQCFQFVCNETNTINFMKK